MVEDIGDAIAADPVLIRPFDLKATLPQSRDGCANAMRLPGRGLCEVSDGATSIARLSCMNVDMINESAAMTVGMSSVKVDRLGIREFPCLPRLAKGLGQKGDREQILWPLADTSLPVPNRRAFLKPLQGRRI